MKHLLIREIAWDTEGQTTVDCCLPDGILVLNAPDNWQDGEYQDTLMDEVSETFGFKHHGYLLSEATITRRSRFNEDGYHLEVMDSPTPTGST